MAEESGGIPWGSRKLPRELCLASTSSSVSVVDDYDVFLNHRGPDVKECFVSHLYDALKLAGLSPFLDKKSLVKGGHGLGSIDAALEVARVHVAVVSEGYAESNYCLSELVGMMRSGKPVIPVFYNVEPWHLRRVESGLFRKAFEKHKLRETVEQLEEWVDALGKLADITGFCFRLCDYKGDEAELKQEVVDAIMSLMPAHEELLIGPHLVGMEGHLKACMNKLERLGSGTSFLGLVGMGGVGKTTLAEVIQHCLVGHGKRFQATSFLKIGHCAHLDMDVGRSLASRLQKQVLSRSRLQKEGLLRRGPVLVVIDDLCEKIVFDELVLSIRHLACGSCIIATSRDRHVLNVVGGTSGGKYDVYELKPLEGNDSQKLFNWHAFGEEQAPEKFKALADDVSKACGGLPLALKVVGSSLYEKRSDDDLECIWPEAVDALQESSNVMDVLKWSYDHLSELEKLMFVDVACLFYGWEKGKVLEIWKGCKKCCNFKTPNSSLRRLIDKSLIVLSRASNRGGHELVMHKLLQDMGKSIGSVNGSHVWEDEGGKVVEKFQSEHRLRALSLANNKRRKFEASVLSKFNNLHYLVLDGCDVSGSFGSACNELRWLQWRNMPLQQAPLSMLDLSNLVSLDFSGSTKLASIWVGSDPAMEVCPNLLRLNLNGCTSITTLPNSIGCLSQLQFLNLDGCEGLRELPSLIGQLTSLLSLCLSRCRSLEALPDSICGLSHLQTLQLDYCLLLTELPMSLGLLDSLSGLGISLIEEWHVAFVGQLNKGLQTLLVEGCSDKAITMVDSSEALRVVDQLNIFSFSCCPMMTKLPETMGLLTNLEVLHMFKCDSVRELPKSIRQLKVLRQLWLTRCNSLESLPDSLDALSNLEFLWLAKCTSITELPFSIGNLSRLLVLNIDGCSGLESVPQSLRQLNSLKFLQIMDCGELEDLGVLRALQGLRMWGCTARSQLPGSTLLVVDLNHANPRQFLDNSEGTYYPIPRYLEELQVVEENDCGLLRTVDDGTARLILQRVCRQPCSHLIQ